MFDISSQKDTITFKRRLTLKKDGILPGGVLDCEASIDLGVVLNSAEGKGIVSKFESLFNGKISSKAKKQDERIDKARQQLAKWVHLGESENKIRSYADTQQEDIIRDWNQFMRVDIKRAANDALEDALKKTSIIFDDLKLKFSNVDLQDNKMEFLTGVLDIAGRGGKGRVAQAGMASLVSGMQGLAKPITAINAGWERNTKLLKQGAEDANSVYKNIASIRKATTIMVARLNRMKKISESSKKVSVQSAKGVDALLGAMTKYQKSAKLNDQDKVVIIANKALSSFNNAQKDSKSAVVKSDTARLEVVLKDISKLLAEAEQLSKANTGGFLKAAKASNDAHKEVKTGGDAVTAALIELRLQFKMS
ncbi:MAG: hypothetical protein COB08_016825 [Rhodobacteraceae bacterium]|nr:hypothetical protein [Paracoccaceae bacterium]